MADRTTPLKFERRARFDVLARVTANPRGALIGYRGKRYAYTFCPNCREWYWRLYHSHAAWESPKAGCCSEACSNEHTRKLKAARHRRWMRKNPGYTPPSLR